MSLLAYLASSTLPPEYRHPRPVEWVTAPSLSVARAPAPERPRWTEFGIADLADAVDRFWKHVDMDGGQVVVPDLGRCWPWIGSKATEYGCFRLTSSSVVRSSRVAYVLCRGPLSGYELVRHRCDNPPCVNPYHLDKGTHQDNSDDMVKRGRSIAGRSWRPVSRRFE